MSPPSMNDGPPTGSLQAVSPVLPGVGGLPSAFLGRYQLLAKLASGGMATVYLGRIAAVAGFDRRVAIKVLHPHLSEDPNVRAMFLDEARLAAQIRHPNVIPVTDVGDDPQHGTFLVMDYVEGLDLSQIIRGALKKRARISPPVVLRIVSDLLAGLGAAHELHGPHGEPLFVVHRDVSPHNILVGTDGIARITDFGIAKAEGRLSSTKTGQLKGKLAYMPPERFGKGGERIDDARGDLFGAAIVLWEALTGQRLFRGEDDIDTVRKVLEAPIQRVSEIHPELAPLDDVVLRGLARDPAERFQTAAEFRTALEQAAPKVGGVARPEQVTALMKALIGTTLEQQRASVLSAVKMAEDAATTAGFPPHDELSTPSATPYPPMQNHARIWQLAAIGLLIVVVGLGAYLAGRGEPEAPPMTIIAAPAAETTPTIRSTPEPTDPTTAAVADSAVAAGAPTEPSTPSPSATASTAVGAPQLGETAEGASEGAGEDAPSETSRPRDVRRPPVRPGPVAQTMEPARVETPTPTPTPTPTTMRNDDAVLENPYAQ